MEFRDLLDAESIWGDADFTAYSVEDLRNVCTRTSFDEAQSCFWYFPRMIQGVWKREGIQLSRDELEERLEKECTLVKPEHRSLCFAGLGTRTLEVMMTDPVRAARRCESYQRSEDQLACVVGATLLSLEYRQGGKVAAYCGSLMKPSHVSACFDTLFFGLANMFQIEKESRLRLCLPLDSTCIRAATNPVRDPQKVLRGIRVAE
jgi:hypothetical protein